MAKFNVFNGKNVTKDNVANLGKVPILETDVFKWQLFTQARQIVPGIGFNYVVLGIVVIIDTERLEPFREEFSQ